MRAITGVLLMCLLSGHARVFAAEPPDGMAAVVRESARLALLEAEATQAGRTQAKKSSAFLLPTTRPRAVPATRGLGGYRSRHWGRIGSAHRSGVQTLVRPVLRRSAIESLPINL